MSPSRGLLIYVPICLWILYQVIRGWKLLPSRAWAIAALSVISGHLWLLVHTGVWPGGYSYGARQFSDVLVWFFVLAVLAIVSLSERWPTMSMPTRRAQVALGLTLLSFSVFVNTRGAYSRATSRWRSYDRPPAWMVAGEQPLMPQPEYWNWRYPQFMAGLLPRDTPNSRVQEEESE